MLVLAGLVPARSSPNSHRQLNGRHVRWPKSSDSFEQQIQEMEADLAESDAQVDREVAHAKAQAERAEDAEKNR